MIIRSVSGDVLYTSQKTTVKSALEEAVMKGVDLSGGDFRRCRLSGARLDGLVARNSCFWGADLMCADMAAADLKGSDLRNTDLKDACLAESNLEGVDFSGAYFNGTVLRQCNMKGVIVSCPSIFSCDLYDVSDFKGALYNHKGETDVPLEKTPIVINGLSQRIVVLGHTILWGDRLVVPRTLPVRLLQDMGQIKTTIDKISTGF